MAPLAKKIFIVAVFIFVSFSFYFYQVFFTPNVGKEITARHVYIRTGTTFSELREQFIREKVIDDVISFSFVSKLMGYQESVKPGKYVVERGMTNIDLIRRLRNGSQTSLKVTFNNVRLKKDLADKLCEKLECRSDSFVALLNDNLFLAKYGFDSLTVPGMFIPNTYDFFWNTDSKALFERMKKEYDTFWTDERLKKAAALKLTPMQVSILASIVEEEQKRLVDERPLIARVYINRLELDRPLQADPTIKFALNDFSLKRVEDLSVESPYNTYKYAGLPPGPICIPSINAIDAVLNAPKHNYLYFCARIDGSGFHDFSETFAAHKLKAIRYRSHQKRKSSENGA